MRALDRKWIRDLWNMRGQAAAIAAVIACGVATFVMSVSTRHSLEQTQASYYERYRFAQVFAHLKRAPQALADRIAEIPGVSRVQTRVVADVTLDLPDMPEPAGGRLISLPERGEAGLNALYLRSGRFPEPGRGDEAVVSEGFAGSHELAAGATVRAVINGRRRDLRVVGVALSPEYVYAIRPGDIIPDERRFGIFWMGEQELAAAFDLRGAFNDVSLTLEPGASEPEVLRRLDRLTEPYGGVGAYGREDQSSAKFIASEIEKLKGVSMIIPTIFLGVAAFLLNVVVSRLVQTQREQIAALKALGYTPGELGRHFLKLVLAVAAAGTVVGVAVGARLGMGMTELYTRFYHFPVFEYHLSPWVVLAAFGVSGTAAAVGTLGAVRRAVALPPAVAMRPEPPANYRPTVIERLGLQRFVPNTARMVLRNLERRPARSLLSALGIAMATGILVLGNFSRDAIEHVLEAQFRFAQRQDVTVTFVEPSSFDALVEARHLPGVRHAEPVRGVAARLRSGHRSRRVGVQGVEPGGVLYRVMDVRRNLVPVPPDGLVMSEKLAELLEVRVGDAVTLEVQEGERPVRTVTVAGLVDDFSGTTAYMDVRALRRMMSEGDVLTGAFLSVAPDRLDDLYAAVKVTPRVAGVAAKEAAVVNFRKTVAENLLRFRLFNVAFACIIAFGVVYNSARVSLAERSREFATLRVIGFTRLEVSLILLGELALLTAVAIPVGLVLGYGLSYFVSKVAMNTELFRIPLVIGRFTYGFAAAVTLSAALLTALIVRRLIDRLDLVAVLKTKE